VNDLENFINIMNLKYKNLVKQNEKIESEYNVLNTNFQRLVYIVISHSKTIRELESRLSNLGKGIRDNYSDSNSSNDNDHINIEEIKKEINSLNQQTENCNLRINNISNEIEFLRENMSGNNTNENDDDKIVELISNYHENIKNNINKINKDLNKLLSNNEKVMINIPDMNLTDISCNIIRANGITQIISQTNAKNITIKKKNGVINIPINKKKFKDVIGKIRIYNSNKNENYKGIITNKNSDNNIMYIISDKYSSCLNSSFEGIIIIKIKFIE